MEGGGTVPWWFWVMIGVMIVCLIADWLIVMGADPRRWKGGKRHE